MKEDRLDKPKVLQIVTQLEVAGAQSMARWMEDALMEHLTMSTVFLYQKSPSDLFAKPDLVVDERPNGLMAMIRFAKRSWGLRRRHVDVVIAHTHFSIAIATLVWGFSSATTVVPVHHWPLERYPKSVLRLIRFARRFRLYGEEVFVSPAVADLRDATVIPNPVPKKGPYAKSAPLRADIVVVARHSAEKSLDTAIEAMKYLPGRHLTLVGGGDLTEELMDLAGNLAVEDQVTFAGRVPNPVVRDLLRRSRVVALTSLWEAMPVALLEAVAEDTVIVASEIGPHRFLLESDAAVGFEATDARSLVEAIKLSGEEVTKESLAVGRMEIRRKYSETQIASQWLDVLVDATSKSK